MRQDRNGLDCSVVYGTVDLRGCKVVRRVERNPGQAAQGEAQSNTSTVVFHLQLIIHTRAPLGVASHLYTYPPVKLYVN